MKAAHVNGTERKALPESPTDAGDLNIEKVIGLPDDPTDVNIQIVLNDLMVAYLGEWVEERDLAYPKYEMEWRLAWKSKV